MKIEITKVKQGRRNRPKAPKEEEAASNSAPTPSGGSGFTAMLEQLAVYEKETEDGDAISWAGQFAAFLKSCPKE